MVLALYVVSVQQAARCPDLPEDIDIDNPKPPDTWPTVRAGLHFLIPIGMLIWCLMIEELSPSLSAFWAIAVLVVLMLTQRPLILSAAQAGRRHAWSRGLHDVIGGMTDGSRNMIGIGVATATAGVIVGGITLTGLGLRMTEFVEFVSAGQRHGDAAVHRLRLPGARAGRADDGQLRAGGHADGAGGGGTGRTERASSSR